MMKCMSTYEIITIFISFIALGVSIATFFRDLCTRNKVQKLTELQIEILEKEKENAKKANVFGVIESGCFIIENSGDDDAVNIRYEGWDDIKHNISNKINKTLKAHKSQNIELIKLTAAPSSSNFKIIWDDKSGKDHVWSANLSLD